MSELERISTWKIEAYGKCNRIYTPVCNYWEDDVTFDEASEIFFELITPVPPRNLVAHASENPDFTFYEVRLTEVRTGFEAVHISWTHGVMKELIEDYKAHPYVTVRAEVEIEMPAEMAEQTDPWDFDEIVDICTIRFVDKDS